MFNSKTLTVMVLKRIFFQQLNAIKGWQLVLVCMRIYWQSDTLLAIRYLVDWKTILIGFGLCEMLLIMFLMGKTTIKKTASDIVLSEKLLSKLRLTCILISHNTILISSGTGKMYFSN